MSHEKPEARLGWRDATAWVSYKLIEVMMQREAVELACLVLRSAGVPEGRGGTSGEAESMHSLTWKAIRQANSAYGELLADWFGLFLSAQEAQELPQEASELPPEEPRLSVREVLDEIRAQAMLTLDGRLRKQLEYETTSGVSWLGEARQRMVASLTRAVRHGKDPHELLPHMHNAPYEPVQAAGHILNTLGYRDSVVRETLHQALRDAGVAPGTADAKRASQRIRWTEAPDDQHEAALRVLRALGYVDTVAREALARVLREKVGLAPGAVAEDLENTLRAFHDAGPPEDAQEAAYRVLQVLGYDAKIAEGAVAKSLGFIPPHVAAQGAGQPES